jgi:hypothetical protein
MMKNLGRTLIILIAASLIALGWYAYSTTAVSQSMQLPRPADFTPRGEPPSGQMPPGEMNAGRPARPEGDAGGFSLPRILTGMAAKIGMTAVVIILVVLLRRLSHRFVSTVSNLYELKD